MNKSDAVNIWKDGALDAFDTAEKLFESKKYHHCLFFLHLALEKLLKGLYISKKDGNAPYVHDLEHLASESGLKLNDKIVKQLREITSFNVAGRYEDYKFKIYKKATPEYTKKWVSNAKSLYKYFKSLYE